MGYTINSVEFHIHLMSASQSCWLRENERLLTISSFVAVIGRQSELMIRTKDVNDSDTRR